MLVKIGSNNTIVNTDHIRQVEINPHRRGEDVSVLVTRSDGSSETFEGALPALQNACGHIVPAPAGFWFASAHDDGDSLGDDGIWFDVLPVLAFRVAGDGFQDTIPITPEGEPSSRENGEVLVHPDGRCWDVVGGSHYASLDEWKAAMSKNLRQARERRAGSSAQ